MKSLVLDVFLGEKLQVKRQVLNPFGDSYRKVRSPFSDPILHNLG